MPGFWRVWSNAVADVPVRAEPVEQAAALRTQPTPSRVGAALNGS
jgi:hypothetical protein